MVDDDLGVRFGHAMETGVVNSGRQEVAAVVGASAAQLVGRADGGGVGGALQAGVLGVKARAVERHAGESDDGDEGDGEQGQGLALVRSAAWAISHAFTVGQGNGGRYRAVVVEGLGERP